MFKDAFYSLFHYFTISLFHYFTILVLVLVGSTNGCTDKSVDDSDMTLENNDDLSEPASNNPFGRIWKHSGHVIEGNETIYPDDYDGIEIEFSHNEEFVYPDTVSDDDGQLKSTMFCRSGHWNYDLVNDMEIRLYQVSVIDQNCTQLEIDKLDDSLLILRNFGDGMGATAISRMFESLDDGLVKFLSNTYSIDGTRLTMTETLRGTYTTYWELVE